MLHRSLRQVFSVSAVDFPYQSERGVLQFGSGEKERGEMEVNTTSRRWVGFTD